MGRWSSITLEPTPTQKVRIISAYQVCYNPNPGTTTAYSQQQAQLIEETSTTESITRHDPRRAFIQDLQAFIAQCQQNEEAIILAGDFNETIDEPSSGMDHLATTCGLVDLFSVRLGNPTIPATYQRGPKRLDYVLLSPSLLTHVQVAGYDPFGYRIPSDHRGLYIDLCTTSLFSQNFVPLTSPTTRDLSSKIPGVVRKYVTAKCNYLEDHNFGTRLKALNGLTAPNHELAEALDRDFQRASHHAACQCTKKQRAH